VSPRIELRLDADTDTDTDTDTEATDAAASALVDELAAVGARMVGDSKAVAVCTVT
jgi:hypothetical protein